MHINPNNIAVVYFFSILFGFLTRYILLQSTSPDQYVGLYAERYHVGG